jgi:hypothetical protein
MCVLQAKRTRMHAHTQAPRVLFISFCFRPQSISHFNIRDVADDAKPDGVSLNMIYFNMKLTPAMQVTCDDVCRVTCDV